MRTLPTYAAALALAMGAGQAMAQTDEDAAAAAAAAPAPGAAAAAAAQPEGGDAAAAAKAPGGAEAQAGAQAETEADAAAEGDYAAAPGTNPMESQAAVEDAIAARDVSALYAAWAGEDEVLSVEEWNEAVDRTFGEEDVNLAVARWDDDSNGVISPVEFEEAVAEDDLFDTVLR